MRRRAIDSRGGIRTVPATQPADLCFASTKGERSIFDCRFTPETHLEIRVAREIGSQDFYGNKALEHQVAGAIDLCHAARAERLEQVVTVVQGVGVGHTGEIISLTPAGGLFHSAEEDEGKENERRKDQR